MSWGFLSKSLVLTTHHGEQSNQRTDEYGEKLYLLRRIATEIRRSVPKDFILGIKLNSTDFVDAVATSDEKALRHVEDIVSWGLVDFLEITGGDYESPGSWVMGCGPGNGGDWAMALTITVGTEFMASASKRQVFFSQFSRKIHESLPKGPKAPLIALTGGFRTYTAMNSALASGHAGLIGIGRLSIHLPQLPIQLEAEKYDYVPPPPPDFTISVWDRLLDGLGWLTGVKVPLLMGAGREMCWYIIQLKTVALLTPTDYGASGFGAILRSLWGVKVRPKGQKVFSWGSCALFVVFLSWVGLFGV